MGRTHDAVTRYLNRLRNRARLVTTARALVAGGGAATGAFAIAATGIGPVVSWPTTIAVWVGVGAAFLGTFLVLLHRARGLSGAAAARLLTSVDTELASRARSAAELATDDRSRETSTALVEAHAVSVRQDLVTVPVGRVVPWSTLGRGTLWAATAIVLAASAVLATVDRTAAGAFALFHPSARDATGSPIAAVVSRVDARFEYPEYLGLPRGEADDATRIEVPRGTSITLEVFPRIVSDRGTAQVGESEVRLEARPDGVLFARFVAREDGDLVLRLRNAAGDWLRDPRRRVIRVIRDRIPEVRLLEPAESQVVELEEAIDVVWEASDDVGLATVDLVVKVAGDERRRRIGHYVEGTERSVRGLERVVAGAYRAGPGERLDVWIEAMDRDEVSGPNRGRSATVTLRVASAATRRSEAMANLEGALDRGLHALADRLERALPGESQADSRREARKRFDTVKESTEAFAAVLRGVAAAGHRASDPTLDAPVFTEMSRRLRRHLRVEQRLYRPSLARLRRRRRADAHLVRELESDVLLVSDVLSQARLRDAAELAKELDQLRREIHSLLSELRRADSPEARAALAEAIERAQSQMTELQARLGRMAERVPGEFVNRDALPTEVTRDALTALGEAVKRGDLDAAERELSALERQIDQLAQALGSGAEAFAEARFGPREQALASAMDSLAGLEAEQHQLARRSAHTRRRAAERAARDQGSRHADSARRLAGGARAAQRTLEGARPSRGGATDEDAFARARQRLQDVTDALRTGDLGEARRMAEEAEREVSNMTRDLELNALMFPGADGATERAARAARRTGEQLGELREALDQTIPQIDDYLDDDATRQFEEDGPRQDRTISATERLKRRFAEGPDGTPLMPDVAGTLNEAQAAMRRGREALGDTKPAEAARAQQDAAERLTELRERLERQQETSQSNGSSDAEGGGSPGTDFREDVEIPSAEAFRGPEELRRRLLDAMRENAPTGFEDAVRQYYEDLLR